MARPKRLGPYAPLSATYASDDAIIEAGEKAELLWCRALAFCSSSESDGYMTEGQLLRNVGAGMRDAKTRANTLVKVGLWERADGGYVIRGWLKWNKSTEEIGRERRRDRERKAPAGQEPPPDSDPHGTRNPDGFRPESERDSGRNPNGAGTPGRRSSAKPARIRAETEQILRGSRGDPAADDRQPAEIATRACAGSADNRADRDSDPNTTMPPNPAAHAQPGPNSIRIPGGTHPEHTRESAPAREQAPAQAYARPVHSTPHHTTKDQTQLPAPVAAPYARDDNPTEPGGQPGTAEELLAEHITAAGGKVNRRTLDELGQQIADLVRQDYTPDEIRAGLTLWRKHSTWPSHLPAQVDRARQGGHAGGWQPAGKPANPNPYLEDLRAATTAEAGAEGRPTLRAVEAG